MTTEICVDKIRTSISQKDFLLMDARLAKYPKSSIVHLDQTTRTGNYLTKAHYLTMLGVWIQWKKKYGRPSKIFTTEPYITDVPTPVPQPVSKGPIQIAVERTLTRPFTNITQFYYDCTGRGYGAYFNDVKTLAQEEETIAKLNCTDGTQLLVHLANEMGYEWRYIHVNCIQSGEGHVFCQLRGKELGTSWVDFDMAANMSIGSRYPIGKTWCQTAPRTINPAWLLRPDDGIM